MPTRNINLTDRLDEFVEESVTSGQYGNASEVVREALRLLAEQKRLYESKLAWLRGAVTEGREQIRRGHSKRFRSVGALKAHLRKAGQVGFDEIDRGSGLVVTSQRQLRAFVRGIVDEAVAETKEGKRCG